MDGYKETIEKYRDAASDEFSHLKGGLVYLDHAANGLYMNSLIYDYYSKLTGGLNQSAVDSSSLTRGFNLSLALFSNPHSQSESGLYTNKLVNLTRQNILRLFNTNLNDYDVIFVSNATQGLKLIAEAFTFVDFDESSSSGSSDDGDKRAAVFAYLNDNHTSVIGMRELAWKNSGCDVYCLYEDGQHENSNLFNAKYLSPTTKFIKAKSVVATRNLFVYPAQSNFSGRKYSLKLIDEIHDVGLKTRDSAINDKFNLPDSSWHVCLDAASFVSTSVLDLAEVKPDFLVVSFYKIFGFPTGIGCVLVKKSDKTKSALQKKSYFGGGTISMALIDENKFEFRTNNDYSFHEYFEDGTISYLDIIGVNVAIEKFKQITFGKFMQPIQDHTQQLTNICIDKLKELKHYNGLPLVELYRDHSHSKGGLNFGPIVAFNLKNSRNKYIGFTLVNKLAQEHKIHLRVGCFCNIGCCKIYLKHLTENKNFVDNFKIYGHKCGDHIDLINGLPTGAVRISFGYCSIEEDVDQFIKFLSEYFLDACKNELPTQQAGAADSNGAVATVAEKQYFKITKIYLYPIKSCAPIEVDSSWPLCDSGLRYDRNWIIIDNNQIPLTQKRLPLLAQLKAHIDINKNLFRLIFNLMDSIDLVLVAEEGCDNKQNLVNICTHNIYGYDCGDVVAQWLKKVFNLENECRLIRILNDLSCRPNDKSEINAKKSFNNQADFLLISENSIRNIRKFLLSDQQMEDISKQDLFELDRQLALQFRPNFVVDINTDRGDDTDGKEAASNEQQSIEHFNEEYWKTIKILNKNIEFKLLSLCTRCQMININQSHHPSTSTQQPTIFSQLFTHLLKKLSSLKSNSKFGVYLTQIKLEAATRTKEDELNENYDEKPNNLLIKKNLKENNCYINNNNEEEIHIGDIGIANTKTM